MDIDKFKICIDQAILISEQIHSLEDRIEQGWEGRSAVALKEVLARQRNQLFDLISDLRSLMNSVECAMDEIAYEEMQALLNQY